MSIETTVIPIRTNGQTIKLIASSAGPGLASRGPTCWPMILHEARRPVTAGDAARGVRHHAVTNPFCPSAVAYVRNKKNKIFFSASAPGECIESVGWVRSLYAHMVSCEHLGGCDSGVLTDCAKLLRVSRPVKSPVKPY